MAEKVSSRVSFLSASFRERATEGRGTKKLQDPETPSDSQFASNSPFTSGGPGSRRLCWWRGREKGPGAGEADRKGAIKLPGEKNLHPRTRINIPGETNVTDRSNLHLTGKRCSVSISTDYRSPLVALLRPCPRAFPRPSAFSSETYIVPRFSNAILSHAVLSRPLYFSRG